MFSELNMRQNSQETFAETLSREERRNARQLMAQQFRMILEKTASYNLYWKGTLVDLVELIYEMYLTGNVVNPDGRPCPFREMVNKACNVLHKTPPRNPYSIAKTARQRKGIRQQPLFSRYCWMLLKMHKPNPLETMVGRIDMKK